MRPGSSKTSVQQALNTAVPCVSDQVVGSPYCHLHRSEGEVVYKTISITGTGGEVVTNIFQVTGVCQLRSLWGVWTDVSETTTLTTAYWDLWDGANSRPITAAARVACSGAAIYSVVAKDADDGNAATFSNSSQCRYTEDANFRESFYGGRMVQMDSTNTYVRFRVTTDGNTDCEIEFGCVWTCRHSGSLVEAV